MGFSVSGSYVILLVATVVAFGMFYTASANKTELVSEAKQASGDDFLETVNTDINITGTSYNGTHVTITVNNTGARSLRVNDTDVVVNGTYQSRPFTSETVDGDATTDLWLPGEELTIQIEADPRPDRVKVVTEHGVAATEVV